MRIASIIVVVLATSAAGQSSTCPTSTSLGSSVGSAAASAVGGGRGSFRQYLGPGAVVTSFSQDWNLVSSTTLIFRIYEGPSSTGPWVVVGNTTVPAQGPGRAEYDSGPMNVPLVTGMWYAILTYYQAGAHTYYYDTAGTMIYPDWDHLDRAHEFVYPPSATGPLHFASILYDCRQWLCLGGGPTCVITAPMAGAAFANEVTIDFDVDEPTSLPVDTAIEFSTDSGATWNPATPAATSLFLNPDLGRVTPFSATFIWNAAADGVGVAGTQSADLRISVGTGVGGAGSCTVTGLMIDSMPTCAITSPLSMSSISSEMDIVFDADHPGGLPLNSTFEFSTDAGASWAPATAAPTSALANPDLARLAPWVGLTFTWDAGTDLVTAPTPRPVQFRISTSDGGGAAGICLVDLVAACLDCSDCNQDGVVPSIIDSLTAAQIAAGLSPPAPGSPVQQLCCDVDSTMTITIIDALIIAQAAAGLMTSLNCP